MSYKRISPQPVVEGGTGAQSLTDHAVIIGSGTAAVSFVGPVAATGAILASNGVGSDPGFTTATYPLTTTVSEILYSSATNTVSGLTTANSGVLTTGATGIPAITAIATDGQFIIGSTAGAPAAGTITSTGATITVTPGANTINLEAVNTGDVTGPGSSTDNALARWDGTGGDTLQNSTAILDDSGNLQATSISFDSGSNILSDFVDTSSWTPTIVGSGTAGAGTYSVQVGQYSRIGNIVLISFNLVWSAHTGTGNMQLGGIPFAPTTTAGGRFLGTVQWSTTTTYPANTLWGQVVAAGDSSTTTFFLQVSQSTGLAADMAMDTAATLAGSIWYLTP